MSKAAGPWTPASLKRLKADRFHAMLALSPAASYLAGLLLVALGLVALRVSSPMWGGSTSPGGLGIKARSMLWRSDTGRDGGLRGGADRSTPAAFNMPTPTWMWPLDARMSDEEIACSGLLPATYCAHRHRHAPT